MKEIKLTQGKTAIVDDEDYERLKGFNWWAAKRRKAFYATRFSDGKTVLMHRQVLNIVKKEIKVDHRDRDGLNNQKINLRIATNSESMANRGVFKRSSSQYFGVHWHKLGKKWQARICKNRKATYLGLFSIESDAALAYNNAAIKLHGEFASLNIVE